MFPSPALQSDAVLDKSPDLSALTLCIIFRKKHNLF